MKRILALFLALTMLLSCALSSASLAEEDGPSTPQEKEMAQVMAWVMENLSEDERQQVLTWDRDTILEKLNGYDQPLEYTTKEEIADQVSMIISLFGMFAGMAESSENGEGVLDLFGAMMGGAEGADEGGMAGLLSLFGGGAFEDDAGIEDDDSDDFEQYGILTDFDGTFWEGSDGLALESVWQDGYYKLAIQDGDEELSYLCEYEEVVEEDTAYARFTGIGTGVQELDALQPDGGKAVFIYDFWTHVLTWQRANGSEAVFTRIIDPLDESEWFKGDRTLSFCWLGENNYQVKINQLFTEWEYLCVWDEETDVMEGTGRKESYAHEEYADSHATFAFNENRTKLTWTDEKEADAADGLTFDSVAQDVTAYTWRSTPYLLSADWLYGSEYYDVHVYVENEDEEAEADEEEAEESETNGTEYAYVCTYDWETGVFTALDPSTLNPDSLGYYLDSPSYVSTATFSLEDDDHILWRDDSGMTGDGIVLEREVFED